MKKVLIAVLAMTALAGCGDGSSSPAPSAPVNNDRTLTLNMSNPNFIKAGLSFDLTGVASSNDGVALSVSPVSSGTLGLVKAVTDAPQATLTVLPETVNGTYTARLIANSIPAGVYKVKAVSVGFAPTFKTYSTSLNYTVTQ